jgi:predicted DNA-binding protein (MmcQ/YjbR family)
MKSNLPRVRKICLSLPQANEVESWGTSTFRIGKIFAMYAAADTHHGEGREGLWVKSNSFTQDLLVRGMPSRYFKPPYVGPAGWTGVYLDAETDWEALTDLLRDAYRLTAPKRLAVLVTDDGVIAPPPKGAKRARSAKRATAAKKTRRLEAKATRRPKARKKSAR